MFSHGNRKSFLPIHEQKHCMLDTLFALHLFFVNYYTISSEVSHPILALPFKQAADHLWETLTGRIIIAVAWIITG